MYFALAAGWPGFFRSATLMSCVRSPATFIPVWVSSSTNDLRHIEVAYLMAEACPVDPPPSSRMSRSTWPSNLVNWFFEETRFARKSNRIHSSFSKIFSNARISTQLRTERKILRPPSIFVNIPRKRYFRTYNLKNCAESPWKPNWFQAGWRKAEMKE